MSEAVPKPKRLRRDTISNPENNGEDVELHVQTERLIVSNDHPDLTHITVASSLI